MIWAGPYATKILADQGAEVIKIESPRAWDNIRTLLPPPTAPGEHWWNTNFYFHEYSRNKKSLTLDLAAPQGKAVFARLVAECDVVIENYRTDVMDNLGLTYEWLCRQRADIIVVGMAGFGKTGPERNAVGYGPIIEMMSGLTSTSGYGGDGMPYKSGISYGDPDRRDHRRRRRGGRARLPRAQRQGAVHRPRPARGDVHNARRVLHGLVDERTAARAPGGGPRLDGPAQHLPLRRQR